MSIVIPAASHAGPTVTLEALQVLERLGGSDGYLKYLQNPTPVTAEDIGRSVDITEFSQSTICEIHFYNGCFSSWGDAFTLDTHKTRLEGWGHATKEYTSSGKLFFRRWEELTGEPVTFTAKTGLDGLEGRLTVWFTQGGLPVGRYIASEPVAPPTTVHGTCTWKSILEKERDE